MAKKGPDCRDEKFFNIWRQLFQMFVSHVVYMIRLKLVYRMEVIGKENIPKDNQYIAAANHLSTLDAPIVGAVLDRPLSYMAKKELFDIPILSWWMDWLGSFAVDREKLSIATIRTALTIRKTNWVLGIFPQGTRQPAGVISNVTKGFASIAKSSKCGILPIGIVGSEKACHIPFTGKIVVKIGKLIPYSDNADEMYNKWIEDIQELTGFKYE